MSKWHDDVERGKKLLGDAIRPDKKDCDHADTHARGVWIICDDCSVVVRVK